jgi:hypothetical protein
MREKQTRKQGSFADLIHQTNCVHDAFQQATWAQNKNVQPFIQFSNGMCG